MKTGDIVDLFDLVKTMETKTVMRVSKIEQIKMCINFESLWKLYLKNI
ncbi:MAG: hypothetical protein K0S61_3598 [Anaerocolumna sp.]|nr:hypothetical protein [Anaerocolumna sp.]